MSVPKPPEGLDPEAENKYKELINRLSLISRFSDTNAEED